MHFSSLIFLYFIIKYYIFLQKLYFLIENYCVIEKIDFVEIENSDRSDDKDQFNGYDFIFILILSIDLK